MRIKMLIYFLIFCIGLFDADAGQRKGQETEYELNFLDVIRDCDDFENKHFSLTDMELMSEGTSTWLKGNIHVLKDIDAATTISLTVYKKDEITGEVTLYYNIDGPLCEHMDVKDKPWTVLLTAMNVKSCPIKAGIYEVERLSLNVDYGKEYMRHEFIGIYPAEIALHIPGKGLDLVSNMISCHEMDTELS